MPWLRWINPPWANRSANAAARRLASARFSGPSAATVHCGEVMSSTETKVGSPPMVSSTPAATSRSSTFRPSWCTASVWAGLYGRVTRGSSWIRRTVLANSIVVVDRSVAPVIAALDDGCGVAASGMWPSPANRAEVGSSPIQPAPGM